MIMQKMDWQTVVGVGLFVLAFVLLVPSVAYAQTTCNGTLTGDFFNDIIVDGGDCTLERVTTTGSVLVSNGGTLKADHNTQISGIIQADGAGDITLNEVTVVGKVLLSNSQNVRVNAKATIGGLDVTNSGTITASGLIESLESKGSGAVTMHRATIAAGVKVTEGGGNVEICEGTTITGGLTVSEGIGGVLAGGHACGKSTINGAVTIEKGIGPVRLLGTIMAASDLIVIEQIGNVEAQGVDLSDIKVQDTIGSVTLDHVTTDSDTTINGISGIVKIIGSTFVGDVGIVTKGDVVLQRNNFSFEDLFISGGSGAVTLEKNINVSFNITERNGVKIVSNTFEGALVTKNTGGVEISHNTGETLSCSDNDPAPTGSHNTIALADGQCVGF